jgi:hypothetical protein
MVLDFVHAGSVQNQGAWIIDLVGLKVVPLVSTDGLDRNLYTIRVLFRIWRWLA